MAQQQDDAGYGSALWRWALDVVRWEQRTTSVTDALSAAASPDGGT